MVKKIIIGIVAGGLLFIAGVFFGNPKNISNKEVEAPPNKEFSTGEYPFINETVLANLEKHFIVNFQPLRQKLIDIQKKYSQKTYIYFAYLNNSSWVGLNEKDMFTAASTVKVPLAMAVYKAAEEGKLKLSDSHTLEELELDMAFGDLYKAGSDKEFSIEDLVKIMLEKSDNTATRALYDVLQRLGITDPFSEVYSSMGWDILPAFGEVQNYREINLKTLSNMFISLYNAGYVSAEHSNKILYYLANSPFNEKIAAGLPNSVVLSHKIGVADDNSTFSDCGIVYAPNRDYLLCLGSNGVSESAAAKFMAEVSHAVYDYVINN